MEALLSLHSNQEDEVVKDTFYYDETSPSGLRWSRTSYSGRNNKKPQAIKGDCAGCQSADRGFEVWYEGRLQQCHRVVYELINGTIPEGLVIDHIDGDRSNNKIENLRAIPAILNSRNRKLSIVNKTGVTGVHLLCSKDKSELIGYAASWQVLEGYKRHTKRFTFTEYGDQALEAAKWWREVMIDFLNADGAGYTERHGRKYATNY